MCMGPERNEQCHRLHVRGGGEQVKQYLYRVVARLLGHRRPGGWGLERTAPRLRPPPLLRDLGDDRAAADRQGERRRVLDELSRAERGGERERADEGEGGPPPSRPACAHPPPGTTLHASFPERRSRPWPTLPSGSSSPS